MTLQSLPPEIVDLICSFIVAGDHIFMPERRNLLLPFALVHPNTAPIALRQLYRSVTFNAVEQPELFVQAPATLKSYTTSLTIKHLLLPPEITESNPTKNLLGTLPNLTFLSLDLQRIQEEPEMISYFLRNTLKPVFLTLHWLDLRLTIRFPVLPLLAQMEKLDSLSLANWESQLERNFDPFLPIFLRLKVFHLDHCLMTKTHLRKLLSGITVTRSTTLPLRSLRLNSFHCEGSMEIELISAVGDNLEYLSWTPYDTLDDPGSADVLKTCTNVKHFHSASGVSDHVIYALPSNLKVLQLDQCMHTDGLRALRDRLGNEPRIGPPDLKLWDKLEVVAMPLPDLELPMAVFRLDKLLRQSVDTD